MNRLSVGQLLGKYELLEQIGTTGLASVYRGRDTASGDMVALKVIHAYFSEENDKEGQPGIDRPAPARIVL